MRCERYAFHRELCGVVLDLGAVAEPGPQEHASVDVTETGSLQQLRRQTECASVSLEHRLDLEFGWNVFDNRHRKTMAYLNRSDSVIHNPNSGDLVPDDHPGVGLRHEHVGEVRRPASSATSIGRTTYLGGYSRPRARSARARGLDSGLCMPRASTRDADRGPWPDEVRSLDDLGDASRADGTTALADREAQTFLHRDRLDQLDRHVGVVARHDHLGALGQRADTGRSEERR